MSISSDKIEKPEKKLLPERYPTRGPLLERLSHIANYQHTRALFEQIKLEKEKLAPSLGEKTAFKNPREETDYLHKKKTLQVLTRQEKNLVKKLGKLQELIRQDMATFDKEVTNNTQ